MTRMYRPALALLPLLLALVAPASLAQPLDDGDRERWQSRLRVLLSELDTARERVEAADLAYKQMRHRNRIRGEARAGTRRRSTSRRARRTSP